MIGEREGERGQTGPDQADADGGGDEGAREEDGSRERDGRKGVCEREWNGEGERGMEGVGDGGGAGRLRG